MKSTLASTAISLRDIDGYDELRKIRAVEKIVWGLADHDVMPLTLMIALHAAGSLWIGAYHGKDLVGFAFGFPGFERGKLMIHSHMLAVLSSYRDSNLGYRLKLAQRDRVLRDGIQTMTWTFDPLQSKNAHFNFAKLGVVSDQYKVNFYGPETSSVLHRNGTDRLWVTWQLNSKRVQQRLQGKDERVLLLDTLANVPPLVRFGGTGRPACVGTVELLGPPANLYRNPERYQLRRERRSLTCKGMAGNHPMGLHGVSQSRILRHGVLPLDSRPARSGCLHSAEKHPGGIPPELLDPRTTKLQAGTVPDPTSTTGDEPTHALLNQQLLGIHSQVGFSPVLLAKRSTNRRETLARSCRQDTPGNVRHQRCCELRRSSNTGSDDRRPSPPWSR